jgi:hypothetical protein
MGCNRHCDHHSVYPHLSLWILLLPLPPPLQKGVASSAHSCPHSPFSLRQDAAPESARMTKRYCSPLSPALCRPVPHHSLPLPQVSKIVDEILLSRNTGYIPRSYNDNNFSFPHTAGGEGRSGDRRGDRGSGSGGDSLGSREDINSMTKRDTLYQYFNRLFPPPTSVFLTSALLSQITELLKPLRINETRVISTKAHSSLSSLPSGSFLFSSSAPCTDSLLRQRRKEINFSLP